MNELALLKENRDKRKRKKVSTPQKDVTIYLTSGVQFHQHFMRGFFVQKFCAKLFCAGSKG